MIRGPPKYTLTDPLFPYQPLFRSHLDPMGRPLLLGGEVVSVRPRPVARGDDEDGMRSHALRGEALHRPAGGAADRHVVRIPGHAVRAERDRKSTRLNSSH